MGMVSVSIIFHNKRYPIEIEQSLNACQLARSVELLVRYFLSVVATRFALIERNNVVKRNTHHPKRRSRRSALRVPEVVHYSCY